MEFVINQDNPSHTQANQQSANAPHQQQPPTHHDDHARQDGSAAAHDQPPHPQQQWSSMRQNPYFFDMDDPYDFFTNPALRSRLSRFQNPWNSMFGQRKRRTSPTVAGEQPYQATASAASASADPHDRFFASHFDAPWDGHHQAAGWPPSPMNGAARKRAQQPMAGAKGHNSADMFNYIPSEFRHYLPDEFGFHPRPQMHTTQPQHQHPPQQQQGAQHQEPHQPHHQQQRNSSGENLGRPQFCDAAMQTDNLGPSESPVPEDKKHSQQQQQRPFNVQREYQQQQHPDGHVKVTADAGVGNSPNGSFASAQAFASAGPQQQPQQQQQRESRSNSNSMGNVRRVPIIVEGHPSSSLPKESHMPPRPTPMSFQRTPPPQQQQPPQQHKPQQPPASREVPIHHEQPSSQAVPEPPSPSIESINKIQQIQQDVLDLMFKVDQYQGNDKADKEYKFLDEMLTRNLLKLDTIDTRGNDSIRLARKEAIKCIQASLSVLEAKADGRTTLPTAASDAEAKAGGQQEGCDEQSSADDSNVDENRAPQDEVVDKSKIAIPMPAIPGQVPAPTIRDCYSDEEEEDVDVKGGDKKKGNVHVSEKKIVLEAN